MIKHDRQEWDDAIQKLINMMADDYPNGFELVITSFSAELRTNNTIMCFTKNNLLKDLHRKTADTVVNNNYEKMVEQLKEHWREQNETNRRGEE